MAEAEKKEAAAAEAPATTEAAVAKPKWKKLLPYMLGGTISVGLGLTAAIVTRPKATEPAKDGKASESGTPSLDNFEEPTRLVLPFQVVNLADQGATVACRLTIDIEVRTTKENLEPLTVACVDSKKGKHYAKIRDAINTLMSGKISTDIKTPRGKELLKLELLSMLAPIVFPEAKEGVVTGIYFEDFVVQ